MTDEATPKKKNKLTGCLMLYVKIIGGFLGLGIVVIILGAIFDGALQKGCNEGKAEDCQSLLDSTSVTASFDPEQITNEEFKPKTVKDKETEDLMASLRSMPGMEGQGLSMMSGSDIDLGDGKVDPIDVLKDEI